MDATSSRSLLIAVDTNVLLDLAEEVEDVTDAMLVIRRRVRAAQFLMPPTVREELADEVFRPDDMEQGERAQRAFHLARTWRIQPIDLVETHHDLARRIDRRVRAVGLLAQAEVNDGLILAEAALLNCSLLLTSDEHLRSIDFERLTLELQSFHVMVPVMATPREIVRKFFQ